MRSGWNDIDWTAAIPRATWSGHHNATISDLKATVAMRDQKLTLQTLTLASGGQIGGSGELDLADLSWNLALNGSSFPIQPASDLPMSFQLSALGKRDFVELKNLVVDSGQAEIQADGSYDTRLPKPVNLSVVLSHLPALEGTDPHAPIRGQLFGKASFSGTLNPMDLSIDQGQLNGSNVFIGRRSLGSVALQLTGRVTNQQAHIETIEANILGGEWRTQADWPVEQNAVRLQLSVREMPLAEIANLMNQQSIAGQMGGSWTIDIPALDRHRITAYGSTEIHDVVAGNFQAEKITAESKLGDGKLVLDPIQLTQRDGNANVHIDLPLANPTQMNVKGSVHNWPATAPSGRASSLISAQTELSVDLTKKSAEGPLKAQASFTIDNHDAGTVSIDSNIDGRTINVQSINAAALGGTAQGAGILPVDEPMKSTAKLTWQGLDAAQLAAFVPNSRDLSGKMSGSAELAPTDEPRALGPLKLVMAMNSNALAYRSIDIGDAHATGYINGSRLLLDDSTLQAAGGQIRLWARSTPHAEGVRSSQIQIDFNDLNLDELNKAFAVNPAPMPGRLAGKFVLVGSFQDRDTLFGSGSLTLTQSNLVNLGAISGLYAVMHIGKDSSGNDGDGAIDLRLDNNTLTLQNARYFNRGVDVRANVAIAQYLARPGQPA